MLELTYNHGVDSYDLGTGYNHIAIAVDDLDGTLEQLVAGRHRAGEAALPSRRPHRGLASSPSSATPTATASS